MGLVNKSVKVTVRTGKAAAKAGETLASTTTKAATNILVNRTSDIYDKHENLTDGLGNSALGNGTMFARTGYRVLRSSARSTKNIYKRKRARKAYAKEQFIKSSGQVKWDSLSEVEKTNVLNKSQFITSHGTQEWNTLTKNEKAKILDENIGWKDTTRKEKWEFYQSQGVKKGFGASSAKQSIKKSRKAIVSNQSRKVMSTLSNKEDMGAKTVGTTARGARTVWKNRKKVAQAGKKVVSMVKKVFAGIISFVTSIPAVIAAIVSSIPLLIIMIVIIIVASAFGEDLDFSGRVSTFSEGEVQLENDYQTSLNPEEILAITSTLGWTTPDMEDYEALLGLAYDGKRYNGGRVDFETMMENVFNKHNPATQLNPTAPITENKPTGITYYSSEGWAKRVLAEQMDYKQWLTCYPQYKNASIAEKRSMGTSAYVNDMKARCRKALEVNGYNYLATFLTIDNPPETFTSYILPENSGAYVSSPTGYREYLGDKSFHYGTDIAVDGGTPIYAPADMTVVHADGSQTIEGSPCGLWFAGNSVILKKQMYDRKGETCYYYVGFFHMQHNSVTVKLGDKVKSGQQIGRVGTTGNSGGFHLHFQTWISVKNHKSVGESQWKYINPTIFTDSARGDNFSVDDHDYDTIQIEGLMFYDEKYRNMLFR